MNAIADWQNSTTLNFVQRTTHTDYIEFRPSTINNSNIGRIGGRQIINLAVQNGVSFRSSRHEIGHAVGFFHEQSRADRDNFITVNWSNIQPTAQAQINFLRWSDQGLPGADIGTFDFNSVMLYPSFTTDTDIAINTNIPILTTINGGIWGTNIFLSAGDIQTAAFIYGPPYARVEYVNVVNESWWTWSFDHEHLEDDVYIRLYSDEQCTIPHNTPVDKQVQIKYVENINGSVWSYVGNATVTAGNHELLLQSSLVTRVYEAEWGTPTYEESRLFYGHSAFFRY